LIKKFSSVWKKFQKTAGGFFFDSHCIAVVAAVKLHCLWHSGIHFLKRKTRLITFREIQFVKGRVLVQWPITEVQ